MRCRLPQGCHRLLCELGGDSRAGHDRQWRLLQISCLPQSLQALRHIRTRPYTPKTNGKAERFIQTSLREWAYAQAYNTSKERRRVAKMASPIQLAQTACQYRIKAANQQTRSGRQQPLEAPQLDRRLGALVARGASVHFLQILAHCIELRTEAFPISGLQSLHCLIVAIKRFACLTCRRACHRHLLCRA